MTTQVAAGAHAVARHVPAVGRHPWLARATAHCLDAIGAEARPLTAYELLFSLRLLDAAADRVPEAGPLLGRLGARLPRDGTLPVEGGAPGEALHLLDLAPSPGRPVRALFPDAVVAADLERLAGRQQPDGGWPVDFPTSSPAAALEWRGYATVRAVAILRSGP
jgi:hypothetical protein